MADAPRGGDQLLTPFYIPGREGREAERIYDDLRAEAESESGMVAHKRRIHRVMCRRGGADTTIEVGAEDLLDAHRVLAILQVGRELYTVHLEDVAVPSQRRTIELAKRTVYAVDDFD